MRSWRGFFLATISLSAIVLSPLASGQTGKAITLRGASNSVEIPLQGMARNEDAVGLATQIRASQKSLAEWRNQNRDQPSAQRLNDLMVKLQDEAIRELSDGYQISSSTSGGFPKEKKTNVEKFLELCSEIFSHEAQFQERVATHISTLIAGANIHFQQYGSGSKDWSTYSDGEVMEIGGYYFRVSSPKTKAFQELVVIMDNPTRHQLAPQ